MILRMPLSDAFSPPDGNSRNRVLFRGAVASLFLARNQTLPSVPTISLREVLREIKKPFVQQAYRFSSIVHQGRLKSGNMLKKDSRIDCRGIFFSNGRSA
jgi:hypothetical protein